MAEDRNRQNPEDVTGISNDEAMSGNADDELEDVDELEEDDDADVDED